MNMSFKSEIKLSEVCDKLISCLGSYSNRLNEKPQKDKKTYASQHYSFLCDMVAVSHQLDTFIFNVTAELNNAESENDGAKIKNFTSLFDQGILLKNTVEEFFAASEKILKEEESLTGLKKITEITLRKIINIRDCQSKPIC